MVMIHSIPARDKRQPATAVFRKRLEHVIEEFNVGRDIDRAAVKFEAQIDLRLFRRAFDDCPAVDQCRAPF
jgi:hypothetical protein